MPQSTVPPRANAIRGVLAPVVKPFKGDLSPDCERFIAHCKWLLSQNFGLAVFGTNSETELADDGRARLKTGQDGRNEEK